MTPDSARLVEAPVLIAWPKGPARGCVLYLHGLSASKEANADDLRRLAERGFVAVGVDAPAHGERREPEAFAAFEDGRPEQDRERALRSLVTRAADEVPSLLRAASERFSLPLSAIGVQGVSFGAFTAYASLLRAPKPAAVAAIIGSPVWRGEDSRSPHRSLERIPPTPVLSIVAERDERVSPQDALQFHEALARGPYASTPERHDYVLLRGAVHYMELPHWLDANRRAAEWFVRWLRTHASNVNDSPR